jgi:HAD superfamily hydrolase (TIGR01509 family)
MVGPAMTLRPLDLDAYASEWERALDAAERALDAAPLVLDGADLGRLHHGLLSERRDTAALLVEVARAADVRPAPWLSPVPVTANMVGLPRGIRACLFDLDGVLTDSALLHAQAWAESFDALLLRLSERPGRHFIPFDRDADYRTYLDGRPRLEGVLAFLQSRGIRLDPDAANELAERKSEALARGMRRRGVSSLPGARRYLEACGHAGLNRTVVSASTSTLPMLELAALSTLVEERVDAEAIRLEGLRSRPAPDLLLAACRRAGVNPSEAVTFTHSPAGVAAGRTAGLHVIGVGASVAGFGSDHSVGSLGELLDRRLREDERLRAVA